MRRAIIVLLLATACAGTPRTVHVQTIAAAPTAADQPAHVAAPTTTTTAPPPRARPRVIYRAAEADVPSGHPCGPAHGLPPCWVMQRESGGNPNAYNPTGCYERRTGHRGCTGKWQCSYSTCTGRGTEAEQDAEARALWDGGKGCSHWAACGR